MGTRIRLLQLCRVEPDLQARLEQHFEVHRWPAHDADAWLGRFAAGMRAVVAGGAHGIETSLMQRLPDLGIVAIYGVGTDRIDLGAARERGIRVSNTPDVLTDDVADLAIGLLLALKRRLPEADRHVRDGHWPAGNPPLATRASGLRYGIVGLGRIGGAIAARLAGFGGSIADCSRQPKPVPHAYYDDVEALARWCDVLFVVTPGSVQTHGLIGRAVLEALGPGGVLVNVARGSVVDEPALIEALTSGRLGGAALDVFAGEPHVSTELRGLRNVALAPHIGSATLETRAAMGELVLANLLAFFAGKELPSEVT